MELTRIAINPMFGETLPFPSLPIEIQGICRLSLKAILTQVVVAPLGWSLRGII